MNNNNDNTTIKILTIVAIMMLICTSSFSYLVNAMAEAQKNKVESTESTEEVTEVVTEESTQTSKDLLIQSITNDLQIDDESNITVSDDKTYCVYKVYSEQNYINAYSLLDTQSDKYEVININHDNNYFYITFKILDETENKE
jgi:hypothetical protein